MILQNLLRLKNNNKSPNSTVDLMKILHFVES